jgi:hypothetical protein
MRVRLRAGRSCERARTLGSVALDAPLAELEARALAAHRRGCAECDAIIAGMEDVTARLRSAPALEPSDVFAHAAARPHRRAARRRTLRAAGLVGAVAAAATVGALVASPHRAPLSPAQHPLVVAERTGLRSAMVDARRARLWTISEPRRQGSPHRRGFIA